MNNQNQEQKTVPELTPEQKPKPKPKSKLPNWASILIIVIAAVIVVGLVSWGGYELFKPTPSKLPEAGDVEEDEFKDWKTYQSEQYNIEFKYSQRLSVKEFKIVHNEGVSINFPSGSILNYSIGPYYDVAGDKSTITIDNKDYDMWHRISDETETYDIVLGAKKAIDFINRGSTDDYELFQKILSTFKFIESDETANWKTYQNEEYEFEVRYPEDLLSMGKFDKEYFEIFFCNGGTDLPTPCIIISVRNINLDQFIKEWNSSEKKIYHQEDYVFNGEEATRLISNTPLGDRDLIFVEKNNKNYIISYRDNYYYSSENPITHNQILSTFRFLD